MQIYTILLAFYLLLLSKQFVHRDLLAPEVDKMCFSSDNSSRLDAFSSEDRSFCCDVVQ